VWRPGNGLKGLSSLVETNPDEFSVLGLQIFGIQIVGISRHSPELGFHDTELSRIGKPLRLGMAMPDVLGLAVSIWGVACYPEKKYKNVTRQSFSQFHAEKLGLRCYDSGRGCEICLRSFTINEVGKMHYGKAGSFPIVAHPSF